ncbi:MAG: hypothetical protein JRL30_09410 [Deltaproteobacteria bacterium]|nr:hypothetical protein [Deltaproteobacteria bacterium]
MKLHHAALVCSSQKNADRFYEGILKLKKIKTMPLKHDLTQKIFGLDVSCLLILYGNEDIAIEVFVTDQVPSQETSLTHLCLKMEDREAFLAACRSVGLAVNIVPRGESELCFVRDFDGNLFEIK